MASSQLRYWSEPSWTTWRPPSTTALVVWLEPKALSSEDDEARQSAIDALLSQPEFLLWSLVIGLGCTVLGAYVGATRAGSLHVRHGGWIAVTSAALGLVITVLLGQAPNAEPPMWYEGIGWALLLPAGLLGGLLAANLQAGPR